LGLNCDIIISKGDFMSKIEQFHNEKNSAMNGKQNEMRGNNLDAEQGGKCGNNLESDLKEETIIKSKGDNRAGNDKEVIASGKDVEQGLDVERKSYSEPMFNRVQKLRAHGKLYGVDVPVLKFELTKPKKRRPLFIVIAVLAYVLSAVVAAVFIASAITMVPLFISAANGVNEPNYSWDIFGIVSGFASGISVLAILLVLVLIALLAGIAITLIIMGNRCVSLSRASREEIAAGPAMSRFIWTSVIISAILIATYILLGYTSKSAKFYTSVGGIVILILALIALAVSVITIVMQRREKQWLKEQPAERQEDYLSHARALKLVMDKKASRERTTRRGLWG